MFLPAKDWRYATAVAYVEGWMAGAEPQFSCRFSAWVGEPSTAWWSTILRRRLPEWRDALSALDAGTDAALIEDLFDELDQYLSSLEAPASS